MDNDIAGLEAGEFTGQPGATIEDYKAQRAALTVQIQAAFPASQLIVAVNTVKEMCAVHLARLELGTL
jgi:hypothetical protein